MKKATSAGRQGFTLIDVLVGVSILAIIAVIGSNMFFSILRSSTKTKTLQTVKQNGNYAISVMERMIRNSQKINSECSAGMNSIVILNPDDEQTEFSCASGKISSNSANLTSNEIKVVSCTLDCQSGAGVKPDVVTINFSLSQAGTASRPEEQASIDFQTTISLRNY